MNMKQMLREAYRRGAAVFYDLMRGGLTYTEAWQEICKLPIDPPNILDLLEQMQDEAGEVKARLVGREEAGPSRKFWQINPQMR